MNKYIKDKLVLPIGFGGWQLGNKLWGDMNFEEGVKLVKEAFKQGVNFFDTAPGYTNGLSESIIGTALNEVRDEVVINTKFGHYADGSSDFSVDKIEYSINESLKRLQTTYIDSILLHNPERYILEGKSDHFKVLKQMKEKGLIRGYGVSIDTLEEMELVLNNTDVDVIEVMFNIMHQEVKDAFELALAKGVSIIVKIPLDSGWLTNKYNRNSKFSGIRSRWSEDIINRRSDVIDYINSIYTGNMVHLAHRFILSFEAVTVVIPGIKNIDQLNDNLNALNDKIDPQVKEKLEEYYELNIRNNQLGW